MLDRLSLAPARLASLTPTAVDAAPATASHRTAPQRPQAAMESQLHPRRVTAQKYPGRAAGAALCSGAEQCAGLDG